MVRRRLGRTGLTVSPMGFGAFKIGRNVGVKYPAGYSLPDDGQVERLLHGILDMEINYLDTAPAYGLSEERIGKVLAARRNEFVLSTKVGEMFQDGRSQYDFSSSGIRRSLRSSLRRLRSEYVDILFIHSDGRDLEILERTDAVETLQDLRAAGLTRWIGFSGKTPQGGLAAMTWADVLMVEYNCRDVSHDAVLEQAAEAGVGIVVKKGLASGHLAASEAIPFVLKRREVGSLVVGGLDLAHVREKGDKRGGGDNAARC